MLNTVVAAEQFSGPSYAITKNATPDRADKKSFFVNVAEGTPVLQLNETVNAGRTKLDIIDPFGVPYLKALPCGCVEDYTTGPGSKSLSIPNPMAGVWEIDVEALARCDGPRERRVVHGVGARCLDLAVLVDDRPGHDRHAVHAALHVHQPVRGVQRRRDRNESRKRLQGAPDGDSSGTGRGRSDAAVPDRSSGGGDEPPRRDREPGGDEHRSRPVRCSTRVAISVAQSAGSSAHEQVTIANPVAGTYTAVVDDFAVGGSGTTQYDYSDVYALPTLGAITTNDTAANHPGGSSWSADAKVTPLGQPGAGRILQGFVQVTSGGAVVGSAEVDLKNVH